MKKILFLLPMMNGICFAKNLTEIYDLASQSGTLSSDLQNAKKDLDQIRVQLGNYPIITELTDLKSAFNDPSLKDSKVDPTSGTFIAGILDASTSKIKSMEELSKPIVFDPSIQSSEAKEQVQERRFQVCSNILGDKFPDVTSQFYSKVSIPYDSKIRKAQTELSVTEKNIASRIKNHLETFDPGIQKILGSLYRIKIENGVVTRLYFSTLNLNIGDTQYVKDTDEVGLTIGMLVNIITDYDKYFMVTYECLGDLTSRALTDPKLAIAWKVDSEELKTEMNLNAKILNDKISGAHYVSQKVSLLNQMQINFLLDLMIQLRKDQISNLPIHLTVAQLAYDVGVDPKRKSMEQELINDMGFYQKFYKDITRLSEYLREKSMKDKVQTDILNGIRSGGNK